MRLSNLYFFVFLLGVFINLHGQDTLHVKSCMKINAKPLKIIDSNLVLVNDTMIVGKSDKEILKLIGTERVEIFNQDGTICIIEYHIVNCSNEKTAYSLYILFKNTKSISSIVRPNLDFPLNCKW